MSLDARHTPSFDGVELTIITRSVDRGRAVIAHRRTTGDGAQLSDRGQNPLTWALSVQLTGTDTEINDARVALKELTDSGATRTYVDLYDGPTSAKLTTYREAVSNGSVTCDLTLIEDLPFAQRAGFVQEITTTQDVLARSVALTNAIADLELEDSELAAKITGPERTDEEVLSWTDETPSREIEQARERQRQEFKANRAPLTSSRARGAAAVSRALTLYQGTVQAYGETLQTSGPLITYTVLRNQMLPAILVSQYGGTEARAIYDTIRRDNSITDPSNLLAGTLLRIPR